MSEPHAKDDSLMQTGAKLGSQVVTSLAPQFLALLLVNLCVLGLLFWFVDTRARHTADVIAQLMRACLRTVNP